MARKKQRVDSISEQVRIMSLSGEPVRVPVTVRMDESDLPFFQNVVAEFARSEWTNHSLEIAAFLARAMADLEREQFVLRQEGSVSYSEKGTPVVNPRKTVVQMLSGSILSLRRSLQLNARAKSGEKRDVEKRRAITKDVEASRMDDDDLLAS